MRRRCKTSRLPGVLRIDGCATTPASRCCRCARLGGNSDGRSTCRSEHGPGAQRRPRRVLLFRSAVSGPCGSGCRSIPIMPLSQVGVLFSQDGEREQPQLRKAQSCSSPSPRQPADHRRRLCLHAALARAALRRGALRATSAGRTSAARCTRRAAAGRCRADRGGQPRPRATLATAGSHARRQAHPAASTPRLTLSLAPGRRNGYHHDQPCGHQHLRRRASAGVGPAAADAAAADSSR